ncbi:MAG: CinA family protein [Nitrospiraceae bacterium]|nr:CinA family protein [Nitrospiraceae bacterium]
MENDFLTVIKEISDRLVQRELRLSVAESCTGGLISHEITNLPGASLFFELGVVSYSEESKKSVVGVGGSLLRKHGTVSEEAAVAMAEGVRKLAGVDVSLSITGIAGPAALEDKEVGLVYMAVSLKDMTESRGMSFKGDRETVKRKASLEALKFLNQVLRLWL